MKDIVRVSAVQFAPDWLQPKHNAQRMAEWTEKEAINGADLVVFPELSNTGYITPIMIGSEADFDGETSGLDFLVKFKKASEPVPGPTTELLSQAAQQHNVYIVVGMAQTHPTIHGTLYNSAVLIGPTGIVGMQHKVHIPNNERWLFYPGEAPQTFETALGKIGMSICYDGHFFPEMNRIQALQGAEIICEIANVGGGSKSGTPSAFHPFPMKQIAYTRALENACYYIHLNRTGTEGSTRFGGNSAIAAPDGTFIAQTDSDQEIALTADMCDEEIMYARSTLAVYRDRRPDLYEILVAPLSSPT